MRFSKSDKDEFRANVSHGVAWLQDTDLNWRERIRATVSRMSPFDMTSCEKCVMSRFFRREYYSALEQACPEMNDYEQTKWGRDRGFDLPERFHVPGYSSHDRALAWSFLEELWLTELHLED